MVNRNMLRYYCAEAGYTTEKLALSLGVSPSTIYRKINGSSDFTRAEIQSIRRILNLDIQAVEGIFFTNKLE